MKLSSKQIKIIAGAVALLLLIFIYRKFIRKSIALAPDSGKETRLNQDTGNSTTVGVVSDAHYTAESPNERGGVVNVEQIKVDKGSRDDAANLNIQGSNYIPAESSHHRDTSAIDQEPTNVMLISGRGKPKSDSNPEKTSETQAGAKAREGKLNEASKRDTGNLHLNDSNDTTIKTSDNAGVLGAQQIQINIILPTLQQQYEKCKSELINLSKGKLNYRDFAQLDFIFSSVSSGSLLCSGSRELAIADVALKNLEYFHMICDFDDNKVALLAIVQLSLLIMKGVAVHYRCPLPGAADSYLISEVCMRLIKRSYREDELDEAMARVSTIVSACNQACPTMTFNDMQRRGIVNFLFSSCITSKRYDLGSALDGELRYFKELLDACLDVILPQTVDKSLQSQYSYMKPPFSITEDTVTIILYSLNILNEKQISREEVLGLQYIEVVTNPTESASSAFCRMKSKLKALLSDEEKKQIEWQRLLDIEFEHRDYNSLSSLSYDSAARYIKQAFIATDIRRIQLLRVLILIYKIKLKMDNKPKDSREKFAIEDKSKADRRVDILVREGLTDLFRSYFVDYRSRENYDSKPGIDEFLQHMQILYGQLFGPEIIFPPFVTKSILSQGQVRSISESIYATYYILDDEEFKSYASRASISEEFKKLVKVIQDLKFNLENLRNEKLKIESEVCPVIDYSDKQYLQSRLEWVGDYSCNIDYSAKAAEEAQISLESKIKDIRRTIKRLLRDGTLGREVHITALRKFDTDIRTAQLAIDILQIEGQLADLMSDSGVIVQEEYIMSMRFCMLEQKKQEIKTFLYHLTYSRAACEDEELDKLQIKILTSLLSMPGVLTDPHRQEGLSRLKNMRLYDVADVRLDKCCADTGTESSCRGT